MKKSTLKLTVLIAFMTLLFYSCENETEIASPDYENVETELSEFFIQNSSSIVYKDKEIDVEELVNVLRANKDSQLYISNIEPSTYYVFDNVTEMESYLNSKEYEIKIESFNNGLNYKSPSVEQGGFQLSFYSGSNCTGSLFPASFAVPQFGGSAPVTTPWEWDSASQVVPRDARLRLRFKGWFTTWTSTTYWPGEPCLSIPQLTTGDSRGVTILTDFSSSYPG